MTRVRVFGGLGNRLRVIFSYRARFGPLEVVWPKDGEIAHGHFLDVFEPLAAVDFVDGFASTSTIDAYPDAPAWWRDGYQELKLLPQYREKIPLGPYSAMHVRRTDHVGLAKQCGNFTTDEAFHGFIRRAPSPIYLATDNGTSQLRFMVAIRDAGKKCLTLDGIRVHQDEDASGQRNTTLGHAVVDLFACVGAREFMGSGESSFTNLIRTLRGFR